MARKSGFNKKLQATILRLLKKGKTEAQIAEIIGVCPRTLGYWKGKNPGLLQAVREAKQVADGLVEAALFSRATGYSHPEEKLFCSEGSVVRGKTVKQYAPDVQAAMFWLRNRQPKRWREKADGTDVTVNNTIQVAELTDVELDAQIAALQAKAAAKKEKKQ